MTLDLILRQIDFLELSPSAHGFQSLRLMIKKYREEIEEAEKLLAMLSEDVEPRPRSGEKNQTGVDNRS
jgi:hypothetical protein